MVLRAAERPDELVVHPPDEHTLADAFAQAVKKYGNNPCLGVRPILRVDKEKDGSGRTLEKLSLGEYQWQTYREVGALVEQLGAGLAALGHKRGENVAVFADTSREWQITAQACFARCFPIATAYPSLGAEAATFAFEESECATLIVDWKLLKTLRPSKEGKKPNALPACVRHVVYIGNTGGETVDFPDAVAWEEVVELGKKKPSAPRSPAPEDLAVIMYTSGSTGTPKGVMVAHRNMIAVHGAMRSFLRPDDSYLAYLPLAHILELAAETTLLGMGVAIGYGTPLTLTDKSAKIQHGTKGDATVLRPTLMAAVPAIMDRIRKTVNDKVKHSPAPQRALFNFAYSRKSQAVRDGLPTPLLDRLVFSKTAALLGGRLRLMLSGGAPLSHETELFMNVCFKCKVGQGYGLTETCGLATIVRPDDPKGGHVGAPVECAEIRLVDFEEGGYSVNDKPFPRGEIIVGGAHITMGYLKNEEKTRESFVDEKGQRWFFTGDIGQILDNGTLQIIDRKKDLVKLSHGEYIALGKIESVLAKAHYVESCCVYADSYHDYPIAIVVPDKKELLAHVQCTESEIPNSKLAKDAVLSSIQKAAKDAQLFKAEIPQKVILSTEPWTPESGLVTAALKLRRENIKKEFEDRIKAVYRG